ncbi:InlB B-repeat-containing protein [Aedoeadaptatus pacaensis]|uniref:InlB B-repeat-containing protein n=1 Tax=Aedoeadaptatus pacaensis TaxID=1776390 RepID=UPI0008386749|nr:InlB B-repeat-containing protein [Peptoniphilus pacaensis]
MKNILKQLCLWTLILTMVLSGPMSAFAQVNHEDLSKDKATIISKEPVTPAKLKEGQTAEQLIKNPAQPAIYTLRTDYKVQRGDKYVVDYQPYIASVGEAATEDEQKRVNKTIELPDLAGYEKPDDDYKITYDKVKEAADGKGQTGNKTNGIRYQANEYFRYKAKANEITIKHVFQDLHDFSKYTNPDGTVGEEGQLITTQSGNTGSTMEVSPLDEKHPNRKGFVPEAPYITMQVPENAENFILEYRYNRAHYDVNFDTKGGTPVPNRTLYYEQIIPTIDDKSIPTKVGSDFLGWMPSITLETTGGTTYTENEIIKDSAGKPILNLAADLKMPASKITFTAVWKDKPKADYAIQFWAEKSDHADNASIMDKYEYMGTRVYKDKDTGTRPDLDKEPVKGIKFPDLDDTRLQKIWNGDTFNRGHDLYLNKFFFYNKSLTAEQNKDPDNASVVKSVSSTGKTVYNIYYDRQVYDLYFTKSNAQPKKNTFYPEIWKYDEKQGEAVKVGGPGNLYHYKARFNEMMYKWPNDAKQTKGFTPGYQSFGWGPNYTTPNWPLHLDTPPYRLNADEFLDMEKYTIWAGYTKHIDKGDGKTIDLDRFDYTTLSFGIKQDHPSIPHHMDFWMDGFKPGETIIRYDLVRTKADTAASDYGHRYPRVQGFTPHGYDPNNPQSAWPVIREGSEENGRVDEEGINDLNDERDEITPNNCGLYYNNNGIKLPIGQLDFIPVFFSDTDDFGDVKAGGQEFKENGYLQFHYKRNKYPLRFNYDPSIIRDDSYFKSTNQLDTFYEFPLKVLSPDLVDSNLDREDREYFKEDPKNLLDNPENLQKLGLTDLVFTDKDGKLKVKRPDDLSDQMVFKGWALDPAGTKLIWENPKETMPTHPVNLYAKWGEPDYKWKVTFDPDGGSFRSVKKENLTTSTKTIQEGDIGQEEVKTYPIKEKGDGNKQVFTVIQRQKLVEPNFKPEKKGYDFMGWEVIRYKKDAKTGDYTDEIDNSYRETYKVPELYSFGNDVVSPIYLKAIWVPNQRVDIDVFHYYLDKDYKLDKSIEQNPEPDKLENKRAGYLVATTGDRQDDKFLLAPADELKAHSDKDFYGIYKEYNDRVGLNNSFFQTFRVEPAEIPDPEDSEKMIPNPDVKNNVFKFFYRPYRQREYKVNYIDEQFKDNPEKGKIIDQEVVTNGNRHYDARNYRQIPGWVLAENEKPQQQLFFDVDEDTNALTGINGTGKDEITFYYKDVRVIEVPKDGKTPDGYVRVTFKADKGGSFGNDEQGNPITELNYDVIKGLKSDLLPVPQELKDGEKKEADKYYITPEDGKKFTKWDKSPLLNKNTIINDNHSFTAYFEWSGLTAKGMVRTEAFNDPNGKWTNDFAPKIEDLKKQLEWREKDQVKSLPAGTKIQFFDENGNELKTNEDVFNLVKEANKADKEEVVRTVNIKVKATFKAGQDPQELTIPITVYKNVYEALNKEGDKPLFLTEAEGKKAEDGGLQDVTGNYVKVTVQPTEKNTNKDAKVYYVNPKAWVTIPEIEWSEADKDKYDFLKWTADKKDQNEKKEENGIFDFKKRHKFTDEETLIKPLFTDDVVEQKQGEDKPKVPDTFVKVIVKTTDKATTELTQTFWVNPTKDVTIPVANPTGKSDQEVDIPKLGKKKVNYVFNQWQKVKTGEADDSLTEVKPAVEIDLAKNKYTDKVTVIEASYFERFAATPIVKPIKTEKLDTPEGKEITDKDLIDKITPPSNKEIESITVVERPDPSKPGKQEAKVTIKYKDGSTQGTKDNPVVIPVEVHKNIIPEAPGKQRPKDALANYVKVIFKAGTGGTVSGDLVYYVSPEVEVDMTASAGKITKTPSVGYVVKGEKWTNTDGKTLKGTFTDSETEFVFTFDKSKDIVEKIDENTKIPAGYVKVTFKTEDENKGKLEGGKLAKIYYVNPTAGITLKVLGDDETATAKQLVVPKTAPATNYEFEKWYEEIDQSTPITSERIHVAKFKLAKVTLTYDKGGEDVTGDVPEVLKVDHGTTVRLAGPGNLAKENAEFAGWEIGDKTYQAGDEVTLNENTTATAQWNTAKHTVMFDLAKGTIDNKTVKDPVQVDHGSTVGTVTEPVREGYVFTGWKFGETSFDPATTPVNSDVTLVAQWEKAVQPIGKNDTVDNKHFIKVTFNNGKHGTLIPEKNKTADTVTYKVAKDYSFNDAVKHGLVVPGIVPAKYYKAKTANDGWDKELKLAGKDATFTAQYEPMADVIPIDPKVTDENQIKKEKPDGMVLVEFKVDPNKAFMTGNTKFYVKANEPLNIEAPVVHPLTLENEHNDYVFEGWSMNTEDENNKVSFGSDTEIKDSKEEKPDIQISRPRPNSNNVLISVLTDGAKGYLEITGDGIPNNTIIEASKRGRLNIFYINKAMGRGLKRDDVIKIYAVKNGIKSEEREYRVK